MSTTTLDVPTISCGHCKSSIEGAVSGLQGVRSVEVGIDAKKTHILILHALRDIQTRLERLEKRVGA